METLSSKKVAREHYHRRFIVLAVAVLFVGILAAALVIQSKNSKKVQAAKGETPTSKGFTMVSAQTYTPTGGMPILGAIKIRYQWSTGDWKQVTVYYNREGDVANTDTGFGVVGRGVFQVDKEKGALNFLSKSGGPIPPLSDQSLRQDPDFVQEDVVLGFKTYVSRLQQSGSTYTEIHRTPELGDVSIKTVFASQHGVEVIEPLAIYIREPNRYLIESLPDYPINYDSLQRKIEAAERHGQLDVAEQMRQQLHSMQQSSPRR